MDSRFTPEDRIRVHDRLIEMARSDPRVVAAAVIGSLAAGEGDRWSDLDLTFGVAIGATPLEVLADWSARLERELHAVRLFDLPFRSVIYRVFLLPGNLQLDVSFAPASEFGALGPKFALIFGEAVVLPPVPRPAARDLFGHAVHHALRARFCIERGREWQAEYWISGVRDQALSLACLRCGGEPSHGRGYDRLPAATRSRASEALVRAITNEELRRALSAAIELLLIESREAGILTPEMERQLVDLSLPWEAEP